MRFSVLVLALALLSACSQTTGGGGRDVEEVSRAALAEADEVLPLALRALEGEDAQGRAGWESCMALPSYRYSVAGTLTAPNGDAEGQLEAVRTALVEAGYEDVTEVAGRVTLAKGDYTLDLQDTRGVGGPDLWKFSLVTECGPLDGDDEEMADNDEGQRVEFTP